jgi:polysaccharide pyruvyl transferase CsaB
VQGFYGAQNLGDDVMLTVLLHWIREQGLEPTILAENATRVAHDFGVRAVQKVPLLGQWGWPHVWRDGRARAVLQAVARTDVLVVGGGDLIRDDRGWKNFSYTMETIVLALVLGKPVYLINVGVGRPQTPYGRIVMRHVLPRVKRALVRDIRSEEVYAMLGASDRCVRDRDAGFYLPDLLGIAPTPSPSPSAPRAKSVVVSLTAGRHYQAHYAFDESEVMALAGALDVLVERTGARVTFRAFHAGTGQDGELHRRVIAQMRQSRFTDSPEWSSDPSTVLREMQAADLVIGMRLHACILGAALGRPVAALPYDVKVDELVRQESQIRPVAPQLLRDPARLAEMLCDLMAGADGPAPPRVRWSESALSGIII